MGIAVLGPLEVDGQANGLSPRDRVVLSALVVRAGEPISTEALAVALWGDAMPASWAKVVHGCVARLRKRLGAAAIESTQSGYRLTLSEAELDNSNFERLFERARDALGDGDPERTAYLVREALGLWRGRALTDLEDWEAGRVEAARLEGLRMDAEELRVEAETRAGHARDVLERARALVGQAPFRERRWALLATALHQAGRQAEALAALKQARAMLVEELGLDPGRELRELEELLLRQDPSLDPVVGREVSASCPYRGLLPYDAADADSFFGREADVESCLRRLRDAGVLAVVGPSGIGKSSLIRAGVVASLIRSGTPVLVTTPGAWPTESLGGLQGHGRQTLVVDPAEEAVTTCQDPEQRARYFAALSAHVSAGGALVLSMRADHLGDLAPYPEIARLIEDGLYLLGPMSEPDLRSAIEGPARRAGLRLEPGLVDLLVREVEGEPAALPMLSHVLRETWERREGPTLTVDGYRATGGIRHAVSQSAERLYDAMDPSQRIRLRTLLLRLVMPSEDGDPVRARVPREKVAADDEHQRLVEQLVNARLVSIDSDTVQIAHEALVRVWPRLRGWLDDDVDGQRVFRHLAGAADAWDGMGRPESELYRGARLARTVEWQDRADPDLNETEAAFLDASVTLAESEVRAAETRVAQERRVNRRLRGALGGVAVLLVLTLVAGLVAVRSADRVARERDLAAGERDRARQATVLAEARRASDQAPSHEDIDAGLLQAAAALQFDTSPQTWDNLGDALTRAGPLTGMRDVGALVGRPRSAHIPALAVSGNGELVAASLAIEGVQLFHASTLEPVEFADDIPVSAVAFSPDSTQLAAAVNQWNGDGPPRIDPVPLRLYDMPSGTLSARQPGGIRPNSNVEHALAFSQDGSRLAAVLQHYLGSGVWTKLGHAMVWDLADPSHPVFRVAVPEYSEVALSPDGDRLYVAWEGRQGVRMYDVDSGRAVESAKDAPLSWRRPTDMDVSPDGSTVAVAWLNRVSRFDAATLAPVGPDIVWPEVAAQDIAYSHDGRTLASALEDRSVVLSDARSGAPLRRLVAHRDSLTGAAFGPGDRTLFTTGGDGLLLAWDVAGNTRLLTLGEATSATDEDYDLSLPSPNALTVARHRAGSLWFEDLASGRRSAPPAESRREGDFTWSHDSRWLLTVALGDLKLRDPSSGAVVASNPLDANSDKATAFSPDGHLVYAAGPIYADPRGDVSVLVTLDRVTLKSAYPKLDLGHGLTANLLAHPDDGTVLALMTDGSLIRVHPETGRQVSKVPTGLLSDEENQAAISPDGTRVAAIDRNQNIRLLELETLEWIGTDSQTPVGEQLVYAPDGSQFASVQPERIRLWDGRTGEYQASLPLPSLTADPTISYLPGSSGLLVAAKDGRTWTVNTRTSTWVERACSIAGRNLTQAEWKQFFPSSPYRVICPQWPSGD